MADRLDRLRIILLGYVVRCPLGGMAWCSLHYLMGLADLGHEVYFIEDSDDFPSCYDPGRNVVDADPSYGLRFAERAFQRTGFGDHWAYYDAHTSRWLGPCVASMIDTLRRADCVINLFGVTPLRPWLQDIPVRVLIDADPVFTQIRHLTDNNARTRALQHTAFFSFGENIGLAGCSVPDDGLPWQATRHPIFLAAWPRTSPPAQGKFTTVMQWDSYRAQTYDGHRYGLKSDSFSPYLDLPQRAGRIFELAVGSTTAPRALLADNKWDLRDPLEPSRHPWTYQDYIQGSRAEFSVAKHGYVVTRSGWFSERSAAYLATGRPVLLQETGYSDWLPAGSGVVSFQTPNEALAGIEEIDSRYEHHCRAARELAQEYFDSRKVLPRLLEQAFGPRSA